MQPFQYVTNTIIGEIDCQKARDRILKNKSKAKTKRDRILAIKKKMTAGKLVLEGRSFHLGKTVLEHAEYRNNQLKDQIKEKQQKADFAYLELCRKADEAIERNKLVSDPSQWKNSKDILTLLKPLKINGDIQLPTRKIDIIKCYESWKFRIQRKVSNDTIINVSAL